MSTSVSSRRTALPIHDLIAERWSPRAFSERRIKDEEITLLLEAARWSPSSFNEQPWRFLVGAQGTKAHALILDTLVDANQSWAQQASLLMIALAHPTYTRNGKPNKHSWYDLGQSVAHITTQATSMGLVVHQMGGFSAEKVEESFDIGQLQPVAAIAFGGLGNPDQLPADLRSSELKRSQRMELTELWINRP